MAKRRASQELTAAVVPDDGSEQTEVRLTPLGAGQEVGRSCIILEHGGKKIMFDCGIHPGLQGSDSLPFLTNEDLDEVSVALITHFHLDHCAAVPYLLAKTNFKGRIFMTHPTKAIFYTLMCDFANLASKDTDRLFVRADVDAAMKKIEVIDFEQTVMVDGIRITPYRAGHVLGAAMFLIDIGGMRALYTGDYSRVTDRHLSAADMPPVKPHIVIVESTYGTQFHGPQETRERLFTDRIVQTVRQGGRVLVPIVAIGRAQELLLLLDEYWSRHRDLHKIPIIQASGVARRALNVFQTYVGMMNADIQKAFQFRNPFLFKHVTVVKGGQEFEDPGPCVVLATPSMLQSGLSRELFEAWCGETQNTVIIADFAVQGTLAREILSSPTHIMGKQGTKIPLRCKVEAISFSAHADYDQTSGFLDELQPPHIVLVHGEVTEMMRLRNALERTGHQKGWDRTLHTPKTDSSIFIPFKHTYTAVVKGRLAEQPAKAGQPLRGVLVQQAGNDQILHPDDLSTFTKLTAGQVLHRQAVPINKPFSDIRLALEVMFEGIEGGGHLPVKSLSSHNLAAMPGSSPTPVAAATEVEQEQAVSVGDIITVRYRPGNASLGYDSHVVLEWAGGSKGDVVADAVLAVLLQTAGEPSGAAKAEAARQAALAAGDAGAAVLAEMQLAGMLLAAQFGPVKVKELAGQIEFAVDGVDVLVDHLHGKVTCNKEGLKGRVEKVMQRITEALKPCALDFED